MRILFLVTILVLAFSCEPKSKRTVRLPNSTIQNDQENTVSKGHYSVYEVIDGDTFWVKDAAGVKIKVRLIGIDAPETRNVFKKKKHPFGEVSKKYLGDLLALDSQIRLEFDVRQKDQYKRTLAYAYLSDGSMINETMIKHGYALIMTVPPNVKYEQVFYEAQQAAKVRKLGIWSYEILDN